MTRGPKMSSKSARLYEEILKARKKNSWNDSVIAKRFGVSRQRVNQCVFTIRQAGVVLPDLRRGTDLSVGQHIRLTAKKLGFTVKEV